MSELKDVLRTACREFARNPQLYPQLQEKRETTEDFLLGIMSTSCDPTKLIHKRKNKRRHRITIDIYFDT